MKSLSPRLLIRLLSLALLFSGCAVGPDYKRAPVNSPENFRSAAAATSPTTFADLPWWDLFQDQTLKHLISTALTNNYDLRVTVSRIEQARAMLTQTRAEFFPQLGYQGSAARGHNTTLGNPVVAGLATGNSFLGAFNAAWEIDLWGRVRRLNESAEAQLHASEESRRLVHVSLVAQVAQAYFELLELDRELEIARHTTNSFGESLRIFSQRLQGGIVSKLETSRAEAALAATAATVPELERQIVIKENQLSVLLGHNPASIERNSTLLQQNMPPTVPPGLPSELLERRPDIREAEQLVHSANAEIGVAVGNFLPRIGLSAIYGGASVDLSAVTSSGANVWAIAANLSGPIFQGGRLYGQYKQARAAWEESKLRYQQTALIAFQEVSNALISDQKLKEIRVQLTRAVGAYQQAVGVSTERYVAGRAGYFELLEAQQQLFPAENALARTQRDQLITVVQLYRALGGGWQVAP